MRLAQTTETFGNQDHSWLGSEHGLQYAVTKPFKVSTFTEGTHYPDGYFPDGLPVAVPTSGSNSGYAVPLVAIANEVQTITITGTPTGGTFTLTFDGETTAAIAYNAAAAAVLSALEALSTIAVGSVVVTGGPGPGTPYVVTFSGPEYLGANVPLMTASGASLTGGTSPAVTPTATTGGGSGVTDGSDILAGFLAFPKSVLSTDTVVHCPVLETGRIIVANLPIAISAAQRATNSHFVWA